jgi:hypothetical protein
VAEAPGAPVATAATVVLALRRSRPPEALGSARPRTRVRAAAVVAQADQRVRQVPVAQARLVALVACWSGIPTSASMRAMRPIDTFLGTILVALAACGTSGTEPTAICAQSQFQPAGQSEVELTCVVPAAAASAFLAAHRRAR